MTELEALAMIAAMPEYVRLDKRSQVVSTYGNPLGRRRVSDAEGLWLLRVGPNHRLNPHFTTHYRGHTVAEALQKYLHATGEKPHAV